ncbi:MAG: hypothetical protein ABIA04_12070 [Pseudomonadota bacterium]
MQSLSFKRLFLIVLFTILGSFLYSLNAYSSEIGILAKNKIEQHVKIIENKTSIEKLAFYDKDISTYKDIMKFIARATDNLNGLALAYDNKQILFKPALVERNDKVHLNLAVLFSYRI